MAKNQLKQTLSQYKVIILADSDTSARMLGDTFGNRGASHQSFTDIEEARDAVRTQPVDVFLCMEKGFNREDIIHLVEDARAVRPGPRIIWTIGGEIVPLADGVTPYPFKPSDLLKPVFFSLKIDEELYASA
ncbi:hypothetical protein [Pseudobacteriovorax antillogorgiicola]|uniref:Response regulatory domain-containing protein n=1 Tax=Pseudobacteriovorax antillogorgiicola TaxID=1513793 RepID=A0A1Y6CJ12_9BACT|nr:hypothetical protein [Pseudobacteriovorax antillogorgiicola]TCS46419.1 hypothetical protein EDD56_12483 [Pseudobacteriovorax antillogorgiicola]SMF68980.1 hypothetical protein SAMN06296036_12483 [Pseudobacteriovorax antillogorgiicola]